MESSSEKLSREVREHISRLSTEELCGMLHAGRVKYTGFALQAAKEELANRRSVGIRNDRSSGLNVLLPDHQEALASRATGCYVEVWRDKNFQGSHALIEGPAELGTLRTAATTDWRDAISSLRVGPRAFVLAYQKCNFSGEMITFGPNQEIPDLSLYRFDNEIESVCLIDSLKIFDHGGFASGPTISHPSVTAAPENPEQAAVFQDSRRKRKRARKHR